SLSANYNLYPLQQQVSFEIQTSTELIREVNISTSTELVVTVQNIEIHNTTFTVIADQVKFDFQTKLNEVANPNLTFEDIKSAVKIQKSRDWAIIDDPNNATWIDIPDIVVSTQGLIIDIRPAAGFETLYTYRIKYVKVLRTTAGYILPTSDFIISTLVNKTSGYDLVKSLDDKVLLDIKPQSLPANAYVGIKPITKDKISSMPDMLAADEELNRERYIRPVEGSAYEIIASTTLTVTGGMTRMDWNKSINILSKPGYLKISYYDTNNDGLADEFNAKPSMLFLGYLNTATKKWELIPQEEGVTTSARQQKALAGAKTVTFSVTKLGSYRVIAMQTPDELIKNLVNYPNPFEPDKFVEPDGIVTERLKGTVVFCNRDENVEKINAAVYTLFGGLVRKWEFSSDEIQKGLPNVFWFGWDGTNGSGQTVANGVYILKIEARKGTLRKVLTRKIAVW
ncbi:MAG: hypothetical protein AB1633_06220, partial [Elusimicrobiota bacterium]